jgi:hypothetical protein
MSGKGSSPRPFSVSKNVFDENWNRIFNKGKIMSQDMEQTKKGTCGCGRSPTGDCCGWHGLTEEDFQQRKELYETGKVDIYGKEIK